MGQNEDGAAASVPDRRATWELILKLWRAKYVVLGKYELEINV